MQRREALQKTAFLIGGILIAPELVARALANPAKTLITLPPARLDLLAEMVDTILPDTDTPGAKAAKVHEFIAVVVEDCLPPEASSRFWSDLEATDAQCLGAQGRSFLDCSPEQRSAFFQQLQADHKKSGKNDSFFFQLKSLTLQGYFTSEIGATQALAFDPIPGGWIPDMKIDDRTKAWTPMF